MRTTSNSGWRVLPHGPLEQLEDDLWRVEASLPNMPLKRCMVLTRLASGGLVVHNGVAVDDAVRAAMEALGPPELLIVPNGWHRLDAAAFKARYPGLRVLCPAGARPRVQKAVPVDDSYAAFPEDARVRLHTLDGVGEREGVLEVRHARGGATLVFNDAVFNQPHLPGWFGRIYRWMGSSGGPRVTPLGKLALVKDRRAFRAHLERLAATPGLKRIIVAHGAPIEGDAAGCLRAIAARL